MANHADIDPYAPPLASLDVEQVVEGTESLAGQGQRLGAHWLDNIVLVAPCIAVALVCGVGLI